LGAVFGRRRQSRRRLERRLAEARDEGRRAAAEGVATRSPAGPRTLASRRAGRYTQLSVSDNSVAHHTLTARSRAGRRARRERCGAADDARKRTADPAAERRAGEDGARGGGDLASARAGRRRRAAG